MIRRSLKVKLIISYLAVAILTVLVVSVLIRFTSGQQFSDLVMEQQASLLKQEAAYYYESAGSWDGFAAYYMENSRPDEKPSGEMNPPPDETLPAGSQPPPGGKSREIRGIHGLVDAEYRAIMPYKDSGVGEEVPEKYLKNLMAVQVNGETVAWIIPDTSREFKLNSEETLYLERANRAIFFAAIAGIAGAVLMGIVLAGGFLKPIRSLIDASKKVAAGDLEQQVPVHSQDELGQLSETFNRMSADLSRSDRQRRQLTADITHDLSTPIQVIAGYMEMLEEAEVELTPQRIEIIKNEIEQLRRLVNDLGLLTTADSKELEMQLEPVDLSGLLDQVRVSYEAIAARDDKTIQSSVAPGTPEIMIDRGRMLQVISNLVENAMRYTPPGGLIQLSARPAQGQVEIRVKDNGSGIHPDDLPYVFDRFYRADKARNTSSGKMGLGLAIAKALVAAQGGSIHVESIPEDPGTTFVLRFPPL